MNDKINVLKMVDDKLDKAVKIQGTDFDRKRKVTSEMREQMERMKKRAAEQGRARMSVTVGITNTEHLNSVVARLKKIKDVVSVTRN